jgi:hypothetical protein
LILNSFLENIHGQNSPLTSAYVIINLMQLERIETEIQQRIYELNKVVRTCTRLALYFRENYRDTLKTARKIDLKLGDRSEKEHGLDLTAGIKCS